VSTEKLDKTNFFYTVVKWKWGQINNTFKELGGINGW